MNVTVVKAAIYIVQQTTEERRQKSTTTLTALTMNQTSTITNVNTVIRAATIFAMVPIVTFYSGIGLTGTTFQIIATGVYRTFALSSAILKEQHEDELDEDYAEKHTAMWLKLKRIMDEQYATYELETEDTLPEEPLIDAQIDTTHRFFIGKDYSNSYVKDFEYLEKYNEDGIERNKYARMPWHDEALVVMGEVARDAARHFIQRWNIHKCEQHLNDNSIPYLLPKTYDDKKELNDIEWKNFLDLTPIRVNAQFVRSASEWSAGIRTADYSIQNAYIQLIDAAKFYIYIENQFFITIYEDREIRNQIGLVLYNRIIRAH
ncbi:unnamed protein product, partial [Didymodactylos carnosus]